MTPTEYMISKYGRVLIEGEIMYYVDELAGRGCVNEAKFLCCKTIPQIEAPSLIGITCHVVDMRPTITDKDDNEWVFLDLEDAKMKAMMISFPTCYRESVHPKTSENLVYIDYVRLTHHTEAFKFTYSECLAIMDMYAHEKPELILW